MGISKDMKYTALYWALRFVETELDIHKKSYNGCVITIYAEDQVVDFGKRIKCKGRYPLTSHKSFVVLECVDRLLTDGYEPEQIVLNAGSDIVIDGKIAIDCVAWDDYACKTNEATITYTSRLVSGLLEYKGCCLKDGEVKEFGFGVQTKENVIGSKDFEIIGDELIRYKGKDAVVRIPEGIVSIGASAFWNNTFVREVVLPNTLERLGGDCFYCADRKRSIILNNEDFTVNLELDTEAAACIFTVDNYLGSASVLKVCVSDLDTCACRYDLTAAVNGYDTLSANENCLVLGGIGNGVSVKIKSYRSGDFCSFGNLNVRIKSYRSACRNVCESLGKTRRTCNLTVFTGVFNCCGISADHQCKRCANQRYGKEENENFGKLFHLSFLSQLLMAYSLNIYLTS